MHYTLTFTKTINGQRTPYLDEQGREVTRNVEADSRTSAMHHPDIVAFCTEHGLRIRRVTP